MTAALPDPADPETDSTVTSELAVIFCDRLTQIIDRRPDVIRKGRGRVNDFADKFQIHYTTAHRLLNGESLPAAALLCQIADTFEVTESWLLGRGAHDVDQMVDEAMVKIKIFKPRSPDSNLYATIPSTEIPQGTDSSTLLYTRTDSDGGTEDVVVKMMAEPSDGKVHLVYDPANEKTYLRRITVMPGHEGELLCFSLGTGATERLSLKNLVFGVIDGAEKKLSIVGPIVARVVYKFKGD